ncbi:MAG: acetyltransferase, partial [Acidimicrobiales bacterium]
MTEPFVVVGAGGHAREVLDVADAIAAAGGRAEVLGVVTETRADTDLLAARGVAVLGGLDVVREGRLPYVIAIGAPAVRRRIDADLS